ncbi:M1 family peptidase [bacterium]|nr:MAG: M1 family peptidase [bacterium]
MTRRCLLPLVGCLLGAMSPANQTIQGPSRASVLRGEYGLYRANNDLLFYHLDVRIDPARKSISGKNTIRFRMLQDGRRIQLDLAEALKIDKIVMGNTALTYERDSGAVFVDFPTVLKKGQTVSIDFYYSGNPVQRGRFGGFTFDKDPSGNDWIYSACEGPGASVWWPNKDQWQDEVESMEISVAAPSSLVDVSNGRFLGKKELGDGYTQWNWKVNYPINNYCVSVNIGNYTHFSERRGGLSMDYFARPESLEKAKKQFSQAKGMIRAFEHYFGEYPFKKDGYKLIEVPYSGMEHQSAVTYGNRFENGYLGRDWTGVGISPRFDFIIIHESGHEWFGNSVSAADVADMWIQEGWTTYLESLYCEYHYGKADALKYINGYKSKVGNRQPILQRRGINQSPPQDQYFKGALFINTLRSVVDDDKKWWAVLRKFHQTFKYKNILTGDVVRFFNQNTGMDLTPMFDEYLKHAQLPTLEIKFGNHSVAYRWNASEPAFAMPIKVGRPGRWQVIKPTIQWQAMSTDLAPDAFQVATDLYYVNVKRAEP